ncbi:MAG: hypothetical protein K6A70_07130 [Erysipelotrichaceae bacterium]|nr:hypothetical protein [Erysipelotrichaceae bacterium]
MKKIIKLITILSLFLLMGCNNTADSESRAAETAQEKAESIAGTYYVLSCKDKDGKELKLDYETLHLNEDGTGMFFLNGDAYELNWTCDNGVLEFTDSEGDSFKGSYTSGMIYGTYFDDITYMFTDNYEIASGIWNNQETLEEATKDPSPTVNIPRNSEGTYFYKTTLYEPKYGIKTANTLVPYGWSVRVDTEWGLVSTMYPAAATVVLVSPDNDACINVRSTDAYMMMARNGNWIKEGTYYDLYNTFLNYRNAGQYNDFLLGNLGYKGTIMNRQGPSYEYQLDLNGAANTLLEALSLPSQAEALEAEGTFEKTSYFVTEGNAYEVELVSSIIMAHVRVLGNQESVEWIVPQTASFVAMNEEAYSRYKDIFDLIVANTCFCENFVYVVQKNAAYLNDMMHAYLMEKAFNPSGSDIKTWNDSYVQSEQDRWINAWDDVITERDTYTTTDGEQIKVSTQYDAVYQNGDTIYAGPQTDLGVDWTQLNKVEY